VHLVDLEPGDPRLAQDVLPVLLELRPGLSEASFHEIYEAGHLQGLRYLAVYEGAHCIGVAGWRVVTTTTAVRKLYVDDLVTHAPARNQGVGDLLLATLAERAKTAGCTILDLDSGVQRGDAHRFYMRAGFTISSFHFVKIIE
jgi:GNAT superfamily N-acetyltransferase